MDEESSSVVAKPSFEQGFNESVETESKHDDSGSELVIIETPEPKDDVKVDAVVKTEEVDKAVKADPVKQEVVEAKPPIDFNGLHQGLNSSYEELTAKIADQYEAGELSYKDAQLQQARLNTRYQEEVGKLNAQFSVIQQEEQKAERDWQRTQDDFFASNADFNDPIVHGALAAALTELYKNPANASKTQQVLLQEAAQQISSKFGIGVQSSEQADELTKKRQERLAGNVSVKSSSNVVQQKIKGLDAGFNAKD